MKIIIDIQERTVYAGEVRVNLTKKEILALEILLEKKSSAISRDALIKRIWGDTRGFDDNLVQIIHRVKTKLRTLNSNLLVSNLRGFGYIFDKDLHFSVHYLEKKVISLDESFYTPLASAHKRMINESLSCNNDTILKIAITI
ncbi:winged helix-turn-helix domain-containing protein [Cedecea davisae]|uniref:winged helix-turn-helix domain-containing protein n=1 Tax=Cedecea davisae TaxID=158484 RepID=UPI00242BAC5D|nr:winged helix-turn-helix domain-containing protein [Cedecea davisae]